MLSVFCEEIKNASTVNSLNLSGCSLAEGAVEAIAKIVKVRFAEHAVAESCVCFYSD